MIINYYKTHFRSIGDKASFNQCNTRTGTLTKTWTNYRHFVYKRSDCAKYVNGKTKRQSTKVKVVTWPKKINTAKGRNEVSQPRSPIASTCSTRHAHAAVLHHFILKKFDFVKSSFLSLTEFPNSSKSRITKINLKHHVFAILELTATKNHDRKESNGYRTFRLN